jgi:hypothetical protein
VAGVRRRDQDQTKITSNDFTDRSSKFWGCVDIMAESLVLKIQVVLNYGG